MDNRTLVVVGFALGLIEFLLLLAFALYRKEEPTTRYAVGYGIAVAGSLLLLGQGTVHPFVSVFLANSLLFALPFGLLSGFRSFFGIAPAWPRRFWAYVALAALGMLLTTFVFDSYAIRATVFSLIEALLFAAGAVLFATRRREIPFFVQVIAFGQSALLFVAQLVRIALLQRYGVDSAHLFEDAVTTPFTLLLMLVSGVLWVNLILLADGTRLVEEMRRRNRHLETLARTDELTGLLNRNAFELLDLDGPAAERRRPVQASILLLDLDDFKRINDEFGHQAGDAALVRTAARIRGLVRFSDPVFRWGGEEFLVLATGLGLTDAAVLGERIRAAVQADVSEKGICCTVSVGIAERKAGEDKDAWFRRADQALYRAKDTGKNRVQLAL